MCNFYQSVVLPVIAALLIMLPADMYMAQTVRLQSRPAARSVTFTTSVGDQTNQSYVLVQVNDNFGNPIPNTRGVFYWSDSVSGIGVTAVASSGTSGLLIGTGPGTATGTIVGVTAATPNVATSRIPMDVITSNVGTVKVGVLDSAKLLVVPCIWLEDQPNNPACGTRLTAANYK